MKRMLSIALILAGMMLFTACGEQTGLQDGYYTAQAADFNFGWKEYITIMVKGGSIVSVEYNAENASGFIKSWDNAYMQTMLHSNGTYPNEYTRYYAGQLLEGQGETQIDANFLARIVPEAAGRCHRAGNAGRFQHCHCGYGPLGRRLRRPMRAGECSCSPS